MKTLSDTTKILIETWSDPGDYPNAVAQSPLPSYDYVAGIEGKVRYELTDEEVAELKETLAIEKDRTALDDWLRKKAEMPIPEGALSVRWDVCLEGNVLAVWCDDPDGIECDPSYRGP